MNRSDIEALINDCRHLLSKAGQLKEGAANPAESLAAITAFRESLQIIVSRLEEIELTTQGGATSDDFQDTALEGEDDGGAG